MTTEAMRLFGEKGYAATSIAQIEAAAGLAPGSGSLYKHFGSKEELLGAGLDRLLQGSGALPARLTEASETASSPEEVFAAAARAGLARMDQDRDLNRLLFRGLDSFPALMARFRDEEMRRVHEAVRDILQRLAGPTNPSGDWDAVAVVLVGAISHYWVLRDLFGNHPANVDEERLIDAAARLAAAGVRRS
ncbi:MAG: TetR/AcrR family transcriptional regulator [Streptosporangiales bacterium]